MKQTACITALIFCSAGIAQAQGHDVFGTFATVGATSHVTITDCGDGSPCGTVSWIDPATLKPGQTPESVLTKAGDPVLGLLMLADFDKKKKDWRGGTIYDPEADKTYSSRLKRLDNGTLQVKGCIGPICQTQIWTEVSAAD
ncbi:MAG: DUF2147 domain-containing protein [Henriciella sp.]|nr:DUF2147 domain-containing protein [Henriciella sp.]